MSEKNKKNNFNQVTFTGFVNNSLIMAIKKLKNHCHATDKF